MVKLGLDLRNIGVDAADLGIHRELGVELRRLGGLQLELHCFLLNLGVLQPKFALRPIAGHLLVVGEPLVVIGQLPGQSFHIGARLLVVGLELQGLLPGPGQRCLELVDLVLERRGINLEECGAGLYRHVGLNGNCNHLAGDVGRDLDHTRDHDKTA